MNAAEHENDAGAEARPVQEDDLVPARPARAHVIGYVVITAGAAVVAFALLHLFTPAGVAVETPRPAPTSFGLVENSLVLTTQRGLDVASAERRSLDTYGWVDRDEGLVRIPIARAVDLLLADVADVADGGGLAPSPRELPSRPPRAPKAEGR